MQNIALWMLANIGAPVVIPMVFLSDKFFRKLDDATKERLKWMGQFKDGQLGWVAVGWCVGALYEVLSLDTPGLYLKTLLVITLFAAYAGGQITAGGLAEADPAAKARKRFFWGSIIVALWAATMFTMIHVEVENVKEKTAAQDENEYNSAMSNLRSLHVNVPAESNTGE
jgi:4-amino-4-deoxy-L-arabinose transferase-like glycosyltransferase